MNGNTVSKRGRFAVLAVRIALVLVAGRLLLAVLVPFTVERVASAHGFDVAWTRMRVHYLRGAIEIDDLTARIRAEKGAPANEPLLRIETMRGDLAMKDLVTGDLRVQRAEMRGVDVLVERRRDGTLPALAALIAATSTDDAPPVEEPAPISFAPPIRVDQLRAAGVRIVVRDELAWPNQPWQLDVDVRADHVGYTDRVGRLEVRASGANLLDGARLEMDIETRADDAKVDARFHAGALRTSAVAPWLAEIAAIPGLTSDATTEQIDLGGRVEAHLRVDGAARDGIGGSFTVSGLGATADGRSLANLGTASIELASLRSDGARVVLVEVQEASIATRIDASGAMCALGFAMRDVDGPKPAPDDAPASAGGRTSAERFDFAVDAIRCDRLLASFRDERFEPAVEIGAALERAIVTGIDTRGGNTRVGIDIDGALSGIDAKFTARGSAAIFGERKSIEIDLAASGIRLNSAAAYLGELGVESTLVNGSLTAKLVGQGRETPTGGVEGDLRLTGLELVDGERVFGVRALEVLGASIEPATQTVSVRDVLVRGTDLPLSRGHDRSFAALGLHTIEPRSTRKTPLETRTPITHASGAGSISGEPTTLPRIEIDRLAILENRISWRDEVLEQPVSVVFDDCGLEVTNLRLFGDPARHERTTANVRLWSHAKELIKEVEVTGKIATRPGPLNFSVDLVGKAGGITASRVQPYLDPTGIQEQLQEASVSGRVVMRVARESDELNLDFELLDAGFQNADGSSTGVKRFAIRNATIAADGIEAGSIEVLDAKLHVSRDPLGALLALGFRIPLSVFQQAAADSGPSAAPLEDSKATRVLAGLPDVRVETVRVTNAELVWIDQSFQPPLSSTARLDLDVDRFSTRSAADPAQFRVAIGVGEAARAITVDGRVRLSPEGAALDAAWHARGLQAGNLVAYLPEGVACEIESGEVDFELAVDVADHEAGGLRGRIEVAQARLAEAGAERPLLALERFETIVERADPAASVFEIRRVTAAGLELDARRDVRGRFHALGFATGGVASSTIDAVHARSAEHAVLAAEIAPATSPSESSPIGFQLPESTRVTLGELDLELAHFRFEDEMRDAAPIDLSARITAPKDQVIVGANARELPPIVFALEMSPRPFARTARCEFTLRPWADEPSLHAAFDAEGISGDGVGSFGRDFAAWIDGSELREGVASGSVEARLRWKRRSPLDLDLRAGFAADVSVGRLEFRDAPDGRVLLALDGAEAEIARVDLATGSVHAKSIELRRPELHAQRTSEGFEILGLVVRPELRPKDDAARIDATNVDVIEAAAVDTRSPATTAAATSEIRVDELVVRGIDVMLHDDAATPPTMLPLTDLDVLVQRFTTRAFEEPRVITIDAWLGAGKASMPAPERASSVVSGLATAVGSALQGEEESMRFEDRLVFQEAALTGRIQFFPELTGHAQATLSGLELLGFTGTAKQEGLDVGDGTLDASVRMRFRGKEGVRVDSEIVFSDLSLAEPKSGPVETYLTLPVPLDTVLFLLENADGEHRIPIGITLDENGLTTGAIAGAAAGAATSVIATAVASAPLRVLSTFTDLFGVTGGEEDPPPSAQLEFAAGTTTLSSASIASLEPLLAKMRADADYVVQVQHRLGAADVARAEALANPAPEICREIADGLRRRRAEIARERGELAAVVRAEWGAGDVRSAEADTLRLRALDAEAGRVEDAFDNVLEHLKPGAERHRAKRTRAAALTVARARVEALRAWFEAQGITRMAERFEAKPPTFDVAGGDAPGSILAVLRERQ